MVESPCIRKCELKKSKCIGCGRTLDEIANWKQFTDDQKIEIINRLKVDTYWPDLCFPPINLFVLYAARWNDGEKFYE